MTRLMEFEFMKFLIDLFYYYLFLLWSYYYLFLLLSYYYLFSLFIIYSIIIIIYSDDLFITVSIIEPTSSVGQRNTHLGPVCMTFKFVRSKSLIYSSLSHIKLINGFLCGFLRIR